MALFSKALRSALSTYRKRKTISLDGSVAGMHPSLPKGHYVTPADGALGAGGAPGHHSVYDAHAHHRWPDREYEQDPSWSEVGQRATTPPLRLGPVPRPARRPRAGYLPVTDEVMHRIIQDVVADDPSSGTVVLGPAGEELGVLNDDACSPDLGMGPMELPEPEMVRRMVGELISGPMEDHPWYGEQEMTEETFLQAMEEAAAPGLDEPMNDDPMAEHDDPMAAAFQSGDLAEMAQGLDGLVEQAMPEPEAMQPDEALLRFQDPEPELGLEAMVEEAMPQPDPEEMLEEEDPWELYLQQMMDPGMTGFGPMPGP